MKPLLWLAAGAAATAVFLLTRRSAAQDAPPSSSTPSPSYGEATRVTLAVPAGWRRVTNAEVNALPELASYATALRNTPGFTSMQYGTLSTFQASDGKTYATWVEQHYHEPGGAAKPWGLHHGVTLLAQTSGVVSDEWIGIR